MPARDPGAIAWLAAVLIGVMLAASAIPAARAGMVNGRAGRCHETAFLEFHHVAPYAAGGAATADNIQLRCRAHNQYEARLFFGDTLVRERPERIATADSGR